MKSYSDLLKDIKKDIDNKSFEILEIGSDRYVHFYNSGNFFDGSILTRTYYFFGTLSFEADNKVYYHLDDSGDNMQEIPDQKDDLFNFMVLTGLNQEDIDIFCEIVDLYCENQ